MHKFRHYVQWAASAFIAFVFIQSLFFKYTNSPETVYIFQDKLDPWAFELTGFHLFAPSGIFSQYVIGTAELVAGVLLIASVLFQARQVPSMLRALGGLMTIGIMSGAVFFHLFTPLGVEVVNVDGSSDGGLLFTMAVINWLLGLYLLASNAKALTALLPD